MLISILQAFLTVVVLWLGLVFGPYMILTVSLKAKSPSTVIRVLYGVYFIALFIYAVIFSPIAYLMKIGSGGFYIGLAALLLILIPLIVMGIIRKTKKEGN